MPIFSNVNLSEHYVSTMRLRVKDSEVSRLKHDAQDLRVNVLSPQAGCTVSYQEKYTHAIHIVTSSKTVIGVSSYDSIVVRDQ